MVKSSLQKIIWDRQEIVYKRCGPCPSSKSLPDAIDSPTYSTYTRRGMKYLAFLTALAGSALAIPESYEARLQKGTCDAYGDTMQSGTGWAFLPDLQITPSHTGTEVDGMEPSTNLHQQRQMSNYEYVSQHPIRPPFSLGSREYSWRKERTNWEQFVFKNETGAFARIDCTDEDALYLVDKEAIGIRVFNSGTGDGRLVPGLGLTPEGYEVYVDGERIGGGFLGLAGVVRWGFKEEEEERKEGWVARLMLPGVEEKEGEVYGFLEAKRYGA